MKYALLIVLVLAPLSLAGDVDSWVGRDDNRVIWSCTNVRGDDWTLRVAGNDYGVYSAVSSNADYTELQLKGEREFARVRLYKDKLMMNKVGSRVTFITMAKGGWR